MTAREPEPDTPNCPRCSGELEPATEGPWPWWCPSCRSAVKGSQLEAMAHAEAKIVEQAEREAARAALERARAERGEQ